MNIDIFEDRESNVRGYCRVYPTVFKSASNARQVDENGRSYIDFFAGAGVLNFGHNNPRMKKALIAYMEADGLTHSLDMYTDSKRAFLEAFTKTVLEPRGMPHKIQFMGPTGTNAVEVSLKTARRVTGRRMAAAFSHGFHGMTLGALACTANSYFRNASGVPLEHVIHFPFENAAPDGLAALEKIHAMYRDSSSGFDKPAGFMVEAIQAEGGVNVASRQWLKAVQDIARDLGALFIIDDIQAGCGRNGSYFSFDGMGLDPDVICLAKGIGGYGTPLAMNLIKPEHDKIWSPGEHTGTFRGQGFSFVAGREALTYFEDDKFLEDVKKKGRRMEESVQKIAAAGKGRGFAARGRGMIQGLDVVEGAAAKAIVAACFESGLLLGACGQDGRVVKLIPPLTIPDDDLAQGLEIFSKAVKQTMEKK